MSSTFEATDQADEAVPAARSSGVEPQAASTWRRRRSSQLMAPLQFEEQMVRLHHQIVALRPQQIPRSILFIGSREDEGTSTLAHEFARVSATHFGLRVLLLASDPDVQRTADARGSYAGPQDDEGITLSVADVPRELTAPSHLTDAQGVAAVWDRLRQNRDLIVVDAPSAAGSPDGLALVSQVDGVVLVVEAEGTRWPVAARTKESIVRSGGRVLGVVFNKRRLYIPAFLYNWL